MCGEIDEQVVVGQDLLEQAAVMARMLGVTPGNSGSADAPGDLTQASGRAAYMERIFRDGLARALADMSAVDDDQPVDVLASQAIALARLAGFLAGQLPPEADLFRALIEAVSAGHAEPRTLAAEHRHQQDVLHGHSHDHDHDHDGGHHHHHDHDHDPHRH